MNNYLEKVQKYIESNNMLGPVETVVVGVSGGPDSMCLLNILHRLYKDSLEIIVVHVNHGLRKEAEDEALFVKDYCEKLNVSCYVVNEDIKNIAINNKMSTEEAGRYVRYRAFEKALNGKKGVVAVAHNMNDNAETVLFNMFRGSSVQGISGIRAVNDKIIRPLLCLKRSEIEDYLQLENIPFCIDKSNLEDDYSRNVIRNHILPLAITRLNQNTVGNIFALSNDIEILQDYMKLQLKNMTEKYVKYSNGRIMIDSKILSEHEFIVKNVIYNKLTEIAGAMKDIERKHIQSIVQLFGMQTGHEIHLPYDVIAIKTYDGAMLLKREGTERPVMQKISIPLDRADYEIDDYKIKIFDYNKNMLIPEDKYTKWLDYDIISAAPCIRAREEGDYLVINEKGDIQKLKKYFVNEKIPSEARENIPLLCDASHVMWIVGYRISSKYKVTENTKRIFEISYKHREG